MIKIISLNVHFTGKIQNSQNESAGKITLEQVPVKTLRLTYKAEREELKRRIDFELDNRLNFLIKKSNLPYKERELTLKRDEKLQKLASRIHPDGGDAARADLWLVKILERMKFQDDFSFKIDVIGKLGQRFIKIDRQNLQEGFARTAIIINALLEEITKDKFVFDKVLEMQNPQEMLSGIKGVSEIFKNRELLGKILNDNNSLEKIWPENTKDPFKGWTFYKMQTIEALSNFKSRNKLVNKAKVVGIKKAIADYLNLITKVREQALGKSTQELIEIILKTLV